MKRLLLSISSLMLLQVAANAQFNSDYAPANWTPFTQGTCVADTSTAPDAITLKATGDSVGSSIHYTIGIPSNQSGTLSFKWVSNDPTGNGLSYLFATSNNFLLNNHTPGMDSGIVTMAVAGGDNIDLYTEYNNTDPSKTMTVTFSQFSAPGNSPLPIVLKSFSGAATVKGNRLDWETAMEENVASFGMERSADGKTFSTIGTVAAQNKPYTYTYTDATTNATAYYRLKVNNIGGTPDYSNVIAIRNNTKELNLSAYPTPATDYINIRTSNAGTDATVTLVDLAGRVLDVQTITNNAASFNIKGQPAGIYMIRYKDDAQVKTMRVVKQ